MKDKAVYYWKKGYNCSQCILKAAETVYDIQITDQCLDICSGITGGFGTGCICSVLIAGIMVLGLLFDELTVKRLRLQFLTEFTEKYGTLNCSSLKNSRTNGACDGIISGAFKILDDIIQRN